MKKKLLCFLGVLLFLFAFGMQAHALMIEPDDAPWSGNDTSNSAILAVISNYIGEAVELYKSNVGGLEEGLLAGSYETTYYNSPSDPSEADIAWTGGDIVGPEAFLLVKGGKAIPAWYLFGLTDLGWDGMATLELRGFWPDQNAISHISLFGTSRSVPEPAAMFLLGTGLIGIAIIARKKVKS